MKMIIDQETALWLKSAYLHERTIPSNSTNMDIQKVTHWRQRTGLQHDGLFAKRLREQALDVDSFARIITAKDQPSLKKSLKWTVILQEILGLHESGQNRHGVYFQLFENKMFVAFLVPFLHWIKNKLEAEFRMQHRRFSRRLFNEESITQDIQRALFDQLYETALQTLIFELHLAREQDELMGETPEERFSDFEMRFLTTPLSLRRLLEKYPLLARLLVEQTERTLHAFVEMFERLQHDHDKLVACFGTLDCLKKAEANMGDRHRRGRSVILLEFSNGVRLVYKPRSTSIDQHFKELLMWVNKQGYEPVFRTIKMLDRGTYGWQEYVAPHDCQNREQLCRFYKRHGGYLALFYMLNGVDMHLENVVASGEHPMMIDLETLFHVGMPGKIEMNASEKAHAYLRSTVYSIGLLPALLDGAEIGGLGGRAGQAFSNERFVLINTRTDQMQLVKRQVNLQGAKNLPTLLGEPAKAEEYVEEIIEGFTAMYQLLLDHRDTLLSEQGPLYAFQYDSVRVILRDTYVYTAMLRAGFHPINLQNGLDRDQLYDFMWRIVEINPIMTDLIASECMDLLEGDVPMFTTRIDSTDIWDTMGKRIPSFFHQSGFMAVLQKLENLDHEDCQTQVSLIRATMMTLERWVEKEIRLGQGKKRSENERETPKIERETFVQAAKRIGNYLAERAIWGDRKEDVTWIGMGVQNDTNWHFSVMDGSLYKGTLGMTFFYAYLAKETGEQAFENLARASLRSSEEVFQYPFSVNVCSAFLGYPALSYVYMHLSCLWDDPELMKKALITYQKIENAVEKEKQFDFISGMTGAILVGLGLYRATGDEKTLAIARRCGEWLLTHAEESSTGIGWKHPSASSLAISGFSHGATGAAYALAGLSEVTEDPRYMEAAVKSLSLERTLFDAEDMNWKSGLRSRENVPNAFHWCTGTSGIALGRALIPRSMRNDELEQDYQIALKQTIENGLDRGNCMCHGDMGNLDVLLVIAELHQDQDLREFAYHQAVRMTTLSFENQKNSAIPEEVEQPGLFDGLAGIGYGFLRFANPSHVPSILSLAGINQSKAGEKDEE
ncbi:type 2 lanthipeptide synthetase LanM family protein [Brevibacillus sp. SYSU BS000544]|uniref:type 2 lanthipeptide synthetase LanM family protein n=1 Tax=Brevibacillus sp. SYSU BS000544 TaxID=3416443 RepID=UPI003CE4FC96